jgi:hypothetical protein
LVGCSISELIGRARIACIAQRLAAGASSHWKFRVKLKFFSPLRYRFSRPPRRSRIAGGDLGRPQRDEVAALVRISPHLRAVAAAHVAFEFMDRRCLRSPHDVEGNGLVGVAAKVADLAAHSVWRRWHSEKRPPRRLLEDRDCLGLQLVHFIAYVKFVIIFYEVLFPFGFPKRTPMRQNARQSISTDKSTTGACVKFRPLFLTHYCLAPTKRLTTRPLGRAQTGPGNRNIVRRQGRA